MAPTPSWIKDLKPSGPQGSKLLRVEREKSNLPVEKLTEILFTKEGIDRQQRILKISNPIKSQIYFDGRIGLFQTSLAGAKKLRQLSVQHNWSQNVYLWRMT